MVPIVALRKTQFQKRNTGPFPRIKIGQPKKKSK